MCKESIAVALMCHRRQFHYCHGTGEGLILIFVKYDQLQECSMAALEDP